MNTRVLIASHLHHRGVSRVAIQVVGGEEGEGHVCHAGPARRGTQKKAVAVSDALATVDEADEGRLERLLRQSTRCDAATAVAGECVRLHDDWIWPVLCIAASFDLIVPDILELSGLTKRE